MVLLKLKYKNEYSDYIKGKTYDIIEFIDEKGQIYFYMYASCVNGNIKNKFMESIERNKWYNVKCLLHYTKSTSIRIKNPRIIKGDE